MFYCYKEPRLKFREKKDLIGDFRYLEVLEGFPNLSTKKRTVEFSSFWGAGSDRILGNDKIVGVPVFTNRKIKTTKQRNTRRVNLSERATLHIRSARLLH